MYICVTTPLVTAIAEGANGTRDSFRVDSNQLALRIFDDPLIQTEIDETERGELRYWSIGEIDGLVLVVVHTATEQDDVEIIRIISARRATRSERRDFEEDSQA